MPSVVAWILAVAVLAVAWGRGIYCEGFVVSLPLLEFVGSEHATRQLAGHTPGYWERMDATNLRVRGAETADEYLAIYSAGIADEVDDKTAEKLQGAYEDLVRMAGEYLSYQMFADTASISMPSRVRVAISRGVGAENGYAHTVGDTVVLPENAVRHRSRGALVELLTHELAHVFQRMNPEEAKRLVGLVYGFHEDPTGVDLSGRVLRANPDTTVGVYGSGGESCNPVFSEDASSLSDVVLWPDGAYTAYPWARNPEHPYEVMAEHVASFFSNR